MILLHSRFWRNPCSNAQMSSASFTNLPRCSIFAFTSFSASSILLLTRTLCSRCIGKCVPKKHILPAGQKHGAKATMEWHRLTRRTSRERRMSVIWGTPLNAPLRAPTPTPSACSFHRHLCFHLLLVLLPSPCFKTKPTRPKPSLSFSLPNPQSPRLNPSFRMRLEPRKACRTGKPTRFEGRTRSNKNRGEQVPGCFWPKPTWESLWG